ncbi:hypothetical protein, partial [Halomonas eurihalina]|uniref:hypothetical protein n=1 Tax=Halomonas eurihalina TaxID=42566 RepID=UPI001CA925AC
MTGYSTTTARRLESRIKKSGPKAAKYLLLAKLKVLLSGLALAIDQAADTDRVAILECLGQQG